MIGKQLPPEMITPAEAIALFDYSGGEELQRALALYRTYTESKGIRKSGLWDMLDLWDLASVISFAYDTGRVQGIREERAKRHSTSCIKDVMLNNAEIQ